MKFSECVKDAIDKGFKKIRTFAGDIDLIEYAKKDFSDMDRQNWELDSNYIKGDWRNPNIIEKQVMAERGLSSAQFRDAFILL